MDKRIVGELYFNVPSCGDLDGHLHGHNAIRSFTLASILIRSYLRRQSQVVVTIEQESENGLLNSTQCHRSPSVPSSVAFVMDTSVIM